MKSDLDTPTLEVPNAEALAQLEEQLRCRLSGRVRDFRLLARDHGLVLRGQSRTYYAKQLAQQLVMQATGISIRANLIDVV